MDGKEPRDRGAGGRGHADGGRGDACASVDLGSLRGRSPVVVEVAAADRAICPCEILHAWASNGIYVGPPEAYAQGDIDQAFVLQGNVTLASWGGAP